MGMVRHDDVATDRPAVTVGQSAPFFAKNLMGDDARKPRLAFRHACGDEIDRMSHPHLAQAPQVIVLIHAKTL